MNFKSSMASLSSSTSNSRSRSRSNRAAVDRAKNRRNLAGKSPFANIGSYMTEKNRKLQDQFNAAAASTSSPSSTDGVNGGSRKGIFVGISIFVDGFTIPSSQELKGYMLKHGGRYQNYFSRRNVSHIICTHLPDSKMRNLRAFSRGLPIVKPDWVVDSVAANKLLNWVHYQLDTPKNESTKKQKLISFFTTKGIPSSNSDESTHHGGSHSNAFSCKDEKKHALFNEGECSKSKEQFVFLEYDPLFQVEDAKQCSTGLERPHNRNLVAIAACVNKESCDEPSYTFYPEASNQKQVMGSEMCSDPQNIMPESASQLDFSVLRELPEDLKAYILGSLPPHRTLDFSRSTSGNLVKNLPDEIKDQNTSSKLCFWFGTPPNWVEKFKLSNCRLLDAFAMLYSRSETNGLLSVMLEYSSSFLPAADNVNCDEWDETVSSLCDLLKEYIELKIESDMEELFVCFRLLRRYALTSKLLSQAYNMVLPFLQASLSENYGGTFKFSTIEE